ncbi:uncharacterized protein J3D65DRAFT_75587 [Phyllosticta citribraziliensis]|uniref:MIT domain-containing protein n=1 Tax=Phyllosticta citribraziliensis TaxID=989973 RepID=A0ABR1LDC9_9PEZI
MHTTSHHHNHHHHHHRKASHSKDSSLTSSIVTVKRAASAASLVHDASPPLPPHHPAADPYLDPDSSPNQARKLRSRKRLSAHRRSSTLSHVGEVVEGIGNVNRWSESSTSSRASIVRDLRQGSFSTTQRRLSLGLNPFHGSAIQSSPKRKSPPDLNSRAKRPHSPPPVIPAPDPPPALPILSPTAFDSSSPPLNSANNHNNHSSFTNSATTTNGNRTPTAFNSGTDYFTTKPIVGASSSPRKPGQPGLASPFAGESTSPRHKHSRLHSSTSSRAGAASALDSSTSHHTKELSTKRKDHPGSKQREHSVGGNDKSEDERRRRSSRNRDRGDKDKKTMLSRALQKANTAVLLDNAQNFEGAMEAYADACKLLSQVMRRSTGEEDRKKLEAIRMTYTNRIQELKQLDPAWRENGEKALPSRPMSNESLAEAQHMIDHSVEHDQDPAVIETATVTRIVNDKSADKPSREQNFSKRPARESIISSAIRDVENSIPPSDSPRFHLQPPPGKTGQARLKGNLESPMDRSFMPPPLSPRRPATPNGPNDEFDQYSAPGSARSRSNSQGNSQSNSQQHQRGMSNESISWLDTIDESGGSSCSSSVRSMRAGTRTKGHVRDGSGVTEVEFDAALDAAVDAAYDDEYEDPDAMSPYRKNLERAKERVREAEREMAIEEAKQRAKDRMMENRRSHMREGSFEGSMDDDDAEDEERMLEEMTRDYLLDDFDFGLQTKSALPRQSDSSTFSGSTWHSSMSSARNTAGTSLSTVTENDASSSQKTAVASSQQGLPSVSEADGKSKTPSGPWHAASDSQSSVRSRRLSAQNAKQLKIETGIPEDVKGPLTQPSQAKSVDAPALPKTANPAASGPTLPASTFKQPTASASQPNLQAPTVGSTAVSPAETMPSISLAPSLNPIPTDASTPELGSRKAPHPLKKNKSSISLRNRQVSVSSPDGSDGSVGTPLSTTFSNFHRKTSNPQITATPSIPNFNLDGIPTGGMHLFEADIHSAYSPGSPNPMAVNAPIPLEPCPDAYLLRPFWLMRCFYQTLVHPRGGYLSTKLFIPRDIWNVKGVKIKAIEEKISNCDYLTAALAKLNRIDQNDADGVLEEMQNLELVFDQVQSVLIKKLGSDVGTNGVNNMFKDANTVGVMSPDGSTASELPSKLGSSSRYLSSWKKLRSKNSGANLSNNFSSSSSRVGSISGAGAGIEKDSLTMSTLPMTSLPSIRFAARRELPGGAVPGADFSGPNANYMSAVARLCDAVQVLDQIARQVEDPGLKHSSPTHVGLELSTRHAAEFFGFYVCRFVLNDVALMLDKFIKRGSEWVLM